MRPARVRAGLRLTFAAAAAMLLWSVPVPSTAGPRASLAVRLVGPIASLAASIEWVRFELALLEGEDERAYAHAQRALSIDSSSEAGWVQLAQHLAFERASAAREPDRDRRRAWIEEALGVIEEGRASVGDPAALDLLRGLVLAHVGRLVEEGSEGPSWPGGSRAALLAAIESLERAAAGGRRDAAEQALALRSRLERR